MSIFVKYLILIIGISFGTSVLANSPSDELGVCLVDTLNGKERKSLAKWIFLSMAAHPEIKSYSKATPKNIQDSDEYIGKLFTRILTIDCPDELNLANKSDPLAVNKAFELVGQVAMQELMSNQETLKALTAYAQYADQEKITEILSK